MQASKRGLVSAPERIYRTGMPSPDNAVPRETTFTSSGARTNSLGVDSQAYVAGLELDSDYKPAP